MSVEPAIRALLLTGLEHARAGRRSEAATALEHARPSLTHPNALQAAAILAFALDAFHDAVEFLERAALADDPRVRASALELLMNHTGRLGWEAEALAAGERLRSLRSNAALEVRELNRLARQGDAQGVITRARRLLTANLAPDGAPRGITNAPENLAPQAAPRVITNAPGNLAPELARSVRVELCNALAASFDLTALRTELALLGDSTRVEEVLERIGLHVEADECAAAEALANAASREWPTRAEPWVWRSRLRVWSGDATTAETHARAALKLDATSADAWCALGAALNGDVEAIDKACALDHEHCEAFTWLADRHARANDEPKMSAALNIAIGSAKRLPVMAWALRSLGCLPARVDEDVLSQPRFQEVLSALEALGFSLPRSGDDARALLESMRTSLRGNYGEQATHVVGGVTKRLPPSAREGPRSASRLALESLRSHSVEEVLSALDEVERRHSRSSLPACHRAEALLWAGRLDEAAREFERAIAMVRGTRFAWIGLTGVAMLRGAYDEALRVCAEGVRVMGDTSGPAVFIYRGEVLRRMGRLEEARADLELAVRRSPRRLSATINLALITDDSKLIDAVFDRAPALISDARRGLVKPTTRQILERALELMRGNRSTSLITYWAHGRMRLVPNDEGGARRVHQQTARELELAIDALRR